MSEKQLSLDCSQEHIWELQAQIDRLKQENKALMADTMKLNSIYKGVYSLLEECAREGEVRFDTLSPWFQLLWDRTDDYYDGKDMAGKY